MSNTNDPDFVNYLHQENSYANDFMADTQTLQRTLFSEMKSRIPPKISTPPARWGPWLYYQYIPEGKEYPVLCRKLASDNRSWLRNMVSYFTGRSAKEEVLLDWNEIAEQYGYVNIGTCRVSPNHKFLAYTLDTTGRECYILQVKDLQSGSVVPRFRVDGVFSLAWAQDGSTLFYTLIDENQRSYRVQYAKLGSDFVDDVPLYTETDASFNVDITSTKDGKFITVNSNSWSSSEVYVIDATNLKDGLQRFHKRVPGVRCFLEHHHGFFYILTNAPLCDGKKKLCNESLYLARCRVEDRLLANWQRIIVPSEDTSLQDMDIFDKHLVLFLNRKGADSQICSISMPIDSNFKKEVDIDDLDPWYFPLPANSNCAVPGLNHDFMNSVYHVVISSPVV